MPLQKTVKIEHSRHRSVVKFLIPFFVGLIGITLSALHYVAPSKPTTMPYTDPTQLTSIPFGAHSHWLQPWRSYLDTVPATRFLNGTGVQWNVKNSANQELVAAMLAKHGIHHARVEIGWGKIDFDDESKLIPQTAKELRATLLALKKYGIRPLILLNAHQGAPNPVHSVERTLAVDSSAGDTTLELDDASGLKVGYSGLSDLSGYWAAESLITNIDGNTITLSKPLPKDIKSGTTINIATLKYRPFEPPGTNDYRATIAGWQRYVDTVAKFVTSVLGTTQSSDKGFDMEIWNELTFGSNFLYINEYYQHKTYHYDDDSIWTNLVKATVAYVNAHPTDFQGVQLGDGFANTIPWPASSLEPARILALDKHPYRDREKYPKDQSKDPQINALGQEDSSNFVPTYSTLFPEYYATALNGATIVRDMGPITTDVNGDKHGRNARVINDIIVPTYTWITEVNINPQANDDNITTERSLAVKAKIAARYFSFFLNKGATQVDLFAAAGGNKEWGTVKQNFLDYAKQPNAVYPTDDSSYTSPALTAVGRMVGKMSQQLDRNLKNTRPLQVVSISDQHNHYQFAGDGSAAHPNLYNRDVFAFLPYQVNAKRFIIHYYVMTRDVMKDLPPEQFTVQIKGLKGSDASVTTYDPINNKNVPVIVNKRGADNLSINLTATDYPYLLTIQSAP